MNGIAARLIILLLVPGVCLAQDGMREQSLKRGQDGMRRQSPERGRQRTLMERFTNPLQVVDCFGCVLGLYDDINMTQTTGTITPGVPKDIYLGMTYSGSVNGLTGIEFSVSGIRQVEDGIIAIVDPIIPAAAVLGTIQAPADTSASSTETGGMNIAWAQCLTGSQALVKITLISFSPISNKVIDVKRKYPPSSTEWYTPAIFQCDTPVFTATRVTGSCYGLNLTGPPPCGPVNQRPVCDAGGNHQVICQGATTSIPLNGLGSFDPEGQPLSYSWNSDCPGASFDNPHSPTPVLTVSTSLGVPVWCHVALAVSDGQLADSCSASVTITACAPNLPPFCDAGGPYNATCQGPTTSIRLNGLGSYDPEGQPLFYSWSSFCPGASFDNPNSPTPTLTVTTPVGVTVSCQVALMVGDGQSTSSCSANVSIQPCMPGNNPPSCDAGGPYAAACAGATTTIALDGTGSSDPDPGDVLSYHWTSNCPGATFDDASSPTPHLTLDTSCCNVSCSVTLAVSDGHASTSCTGVVTVTAGGPQPVAIVLWPPDHQYLSILPQDCLASGCQGPIDPSRVRVVSVSSDEPEDENGNGDGNTLNDIVVTCPNVVQLRAEREGNGDGRVYIITYAVLPVSGPEQIVQCRVEVPHAQSGAEAVQGPGPGYSVTPNCALGVQVSQSSKAGSNDSGGEPARLVVSRAGDMGIGLSFEMPNSGRAHVEIYDVAGRLVRRTAEELSGGPQTLYWDGRDASGRAAPSGIYIVRVRAGDARLTTKVVWSR